MSNPVPTEIERYYDERVAGKIRDFTEFNPRIEAAVRGIAEWAPPRPRRILEIGCGIGATSWRMARAWPNAEVIGADVSPRSIEVAKTCFRLPNLSYYSGLVEPRTFEGTFDFIVMMDVYEHIAVSDRPALHEAFRSLLGPDSRAFFSVPTPACQQYARDVIPDALQPIDEDIRVEEVLKLANDTGCSILYYREVGIWHQGDYAHFAIGRFRKLSDVPPCLWNPDISIKGQLKSVLGKGTPCNEEEYYLGPSAHLPTRRGRIQKFSVQRMTRVRLANQWTVNDH